MRAFVFSVAAVAALLPAVFAQTYTECNALNTTGCPNMPAFGGNASFAFNETLNPKLWMNRNQGSIERTEKGVALTVSARGDSPQLVSNFYMFFGRLEVVMKAAPGQGIISSAILQSEVLDEIDWEFKGGDSTQVLTNYFGKGNNSYDEANLRGEDFEEGETQNDYRNYTLDWTKERIQWWLDGKMLRELKFEEALGGRNYPQTPCNIRVGVWSGGDVENNPKDTVKWAGGPTDFSKGPFTMMVESIYAKDYTSAKEYSWEDMDGSGSWEKVKVIEGKSEAIEEIEKPSGVRNRWKALSKGAQIGIIGGIIGVVALGAAGGLFYFIRQRRAGQREFAAYKAEADKEHTEFLQYQGGFQSQPTAGNSAGYNRL